MLGLLLSKAKYGFQLFNKFKFEFSGNKCDNNNFNFMTCTKFLL